jgi:hypothetical protein
MIISDNFSLSHAKAVRGKAGPYFILCFDKLTVLIFYFHLIMRNLIAAKLNNETAD